VQEAARARLERSRRKDPDAECASSDKNSGAAAEPAVTSKNKSTMSTGKRGAKVGTGGLDESEEENA
jgi:hypothetical protein